MKKIEVPAVWLKKLVKLANEAQGVEGSKLARLRNHALSIEKEPMVKPIKEKAGIDD